MPISLINRLETDFNSYLLTLGFLTRSTSNHATIFLLIQSNSQTSWQTLSTTSSQLSFTRIIHRNINRSNFLINLTSNIRNLTHCRCSRTTISIRLRACRSTRTLVRSIRNPITIIIGRFGNRHLGRIQSLVPILNSNRNLSTRRSTGRNRNLDTTILLNRTGRTIISRTLHRIRQLTILLILTQGHIRARIATTITPSRATTISRRTGNTRTLIRSIRNPITITIGIDFLSNFQLNSVGHGADNGFTVNLLFNLVLHFQSMFTDCRLFGDSYRPVLCESYPVYRFLKRKVFGFSSIWHSGDVQSGSLVSAVGIHRECIFFKRQIQDRQSVLERNCQWLELLILSLTVIGLNRAGGSS